MKKPGSIAIIIPYFGQWPEWIDYFFLSCARNPGINWLIFTDCPAREMNANNILLIPFTLGDFNRLASLKTGLSPDISHPYKICDFKPAFGDIFEGYISEFEYWGYGDLDLIYGNFRDFFTRSTFQQYDIISNHGNFVTGHLCILRNTPEIRHLYREGGFYKKAFSNQWYTGFDEKKKILAIATNPRISDKMKNLDRALHMQVTAFRRALYRHWPLNTGRRTGPRKIRNTNDFSAIVKNAEAQGRVKVHYETTFQSDLMLRKRGRKDWSVRWENGNLFNEPDHRKLLYFHMILSKASKSFRIDRFDDHTRSFTLSGSGIKICKRN